jgi:CBS domain-containing protein
VADALDRLLEEGFRHLPVLENGELVGMVSLRDLSRGNAG